MANSTTDTTTDSGADTTAVSGTGTTADSGTSGSLTSQTATSIISLEVPSSGLIGSNASVQVAPNTATTLTGSDGQDILVGGISGDHLVGGDGDDVLIGAGGRNILEGGGGNDTFGHAADAVDIITDFAPGQGEKLALAAGLSVSTSSQGTIAADLGDGVANHDAQILTLSDNSTIALIGVTDQFSTDWLTTTTA